MSWRRIAFGLVMTKEVCLEGIGAEELLTTQLRFWIKLVHLPPLLGMGAQQLVPQKQAPLPFVHHEEAGAICRRA